MCEPPEWCDTDIPDAPTRDDIWAKCAEWASIDGTCDEVWRDEVAEGIIAQIAAHVAGEDVRVDDGEKEISPFEGEYVLRGPLIKTIKCELSFAATGEVGADCLQGSSSSCKT
ncbi:hypothetical protein M8818_006200 [Zalaria obscura]|uniref:Uncharacterized protein n=1 Tax=Zalaria obscura TaxID=2024903 RepID=A0ACC3S7B3_9PEZI